MPTTRIMSNYNKFSGQDLIIADKILHRRLQLLVHSRIYYEMDGNIVSDKQWDLWARELVQLQKDYPEISSKVEWYDAFEDWDASTGAFLPLHDEWVVTKCKQLFGGLSPNKSSDTKVVVKQLEPVKTSVPKKKKGKLF